MSSVTTRPAPVTTRQRLGNVLVERGYLTVAQLEDSLVIQEKSDSNKLLGEVLVECEFCTEDQVVEALAVEYEIPYAKLESRLFDSKIVDVLSREVIEKNLIFPLFVIRDTLTLAVSEPSNQFLIDELHRQTGLSIQIVAATPRDIRRLIQTLPDSKTFVIDDIIEDSDKAEVTLIEEVIDDIGDVAEVASQSPVIRLVNYILYNAAKEGASDIHIEPAEKCLRVRYRIDGKLYKSLEVPSHLLNAVVSRIKIMADMDISERRLPQDGRMNVAMDGRKIDLRVSTFTTIKGEKTVIRVLDTRGTSLNLNELGFSEDILRKFQANITAPNGIILVTGPTGSGKSTTLYGAMNDIATMENNVCTVEDPIEYNLPLINQFQVIEKVGMTFAMALRTLLRQDPDIIMVGEVRDEETARTAIQAALTGHLVFSTLHTNDAPSAITRLVNMGVEPFLISAALNMVLAQRLVRRTCTRCRQKYDVPRTLRRALEKMGCEIETFYKGVGCKRCRNTGYAGRLGVHEIMVVNDEIRDAVVAGASVGEIKRLGDENGMITLRQDGLRKVREGITTIEEVMHIAGDLRDTSKV